MEVAEMAKIQVRLTELYACYTYLNTGYGIWIRGTRYLPSKLKKEFIDTIGLEYLNKQVGKRYYGDEDKVWEYFKSNFGEVLEKKNIKDYQHLYAKMMDNSINM